MNVLKHIIMTAVLVMAAFSAPEAKIPPIEEEYCPSGEFAVEPVYGRDCIAFRVYGVSTYEYLQVYYNITFTDGTTATFTSFDASNDFMTYTYGYNCGTGWPATVCATARYYCNGIPTISQNCVNL